MRRQYTEKEENYIRKAYAKEIHPDIIAKKLSRPVQEIRRKAAMLGCTRKREKEWQQWELDFLLNHYQNLTNREIAEALRRTPQSVKGKLCRINLHRAPQQQINPDGRIWTEAEDTYLKNHASTDSWAEIGKALNRTEHSVRARATKLGLREAKSRYWTRAEDNWLEDHYETMSVSQIARKLGRSEFSVKGRAARLNLSAYHNEYLQLSDIAECFNVHVSTVSRWISQKHLPAKQVKRGSCIGYLIDTEVFWKWAEENKDFVPFRNYEPMSLLPEPENIMELIEADKDPCRAKSRKPITMSVRRNIQKDWNSGMSLAELSAKHGRSVHSIKHIITDNPKYL